MPINVIDNFNINVARPIDARIVATNSNHRTSITYKYDGLKVYQQDTKMNYTWNSTTSNWDKLNIYSTGSNVGVNADPNDPSTFRGSLQVNSIDSTKPFVVQVGSMTAMSGVSSVIGYNWFYASGIENAFSPLNGTSGIVFNSDGSIIISSGTEYTTGLLGDNQVIKINPTAENVADVRFTSDLYIMGVVGVNASNKSGLASYTTTSFDAHLIPIFDSHSMDYNGTIMVTAYATGYSFTGGITYSYSNTITAIFAGGPTSSLSQQSVSHYEYIDSSGAEFGIILSNSDRYIFVVFNSDATSLHTNWKCKYDILY
jgi:hypothetical protein